MLSAYRCTAKLHSFFTRHVVEATTREINTSLIDSALMKIKNAITLAPIIDIVNNDFSRGF